MKTHTVRVMDTKTNTVKSYIAERRDTKITYTINSIGKNKPSENLHRKGINKDMHIQNIQSEQHRQRQTTKTNTVKSMVKDKQTH